VSEEPQLPPIPAIGDVLDRKERFIQKVYSVIKCQDCSKKYTRKFRPGDFTFKKLPDKTCPECSKTNVLTIVEIYSKWIDPKKQKKEEEN